MVPVLSCRTVRTLLPLSETPTCKDNGFVSPLAQNQWHQMRAACLCCGSLEMGRWLERSWLILLYSEQSSVLFSLHFQASLLRFVWQPAFGSPFASSVQVTSSCSLLCCLFAHQSHDPVLNLVSTEEIKIICWCCGFLGPAGFSGTCRDKCFDQGPAAWVVWESLIQQLWPQAGYLPGELQHWERGLCRHSSHHLQQSGITLAVH